MRRIMAEEPNECRRFLLAEFVQAYLPLNETELQEFEGLLQTDVSRGQVGGIVG